MTLENRKTIFKSELKQLKEHSYIDQEAYTKVADAYDQYFELMIEKKVAEENLLIEQRKARQEEVKRLAEERKEQLRLKKEAKKLTPEQVRERNISLALIAGVVLLLLGGLVLATSSWEKMNHLMKVFSIAFVSLLFFGISYVARKYLKIDKTAFAFLTLASLLIPVTFIGIGYFQLFGEWISLFGGGRHVLGVIATLTCLPLYAWIAYQSKKRLFVWLSFLTLTALCGFVLAATLLPIDFFYLGIIIYNGLLLAGYHYLKDNNKYGLFVRELPLFSQANLVVSTLLMLVFFQNNVLYSVNILLTAVIYLSVVFVYKKKEFHYVFTLLLVYGIYQLLEHSFLQPLNYLGFALIGIFYLIIEDRLSDSSLKKVFKYTSAIISALAFFYISFEGLLLRYDENSVVLLVAYLMISLNYIYLAFITKRRVFQFLAPIFLVVSGYQSWNLLSGVFSFDLKGLYIVELYMFAVGVVMFLLLYVRNTHKYLLPIKHTSFYVSVATMVLSIVSSYFGGKDLELSILLIVFGVILLIINATHDKASYQEASAWMFPISWLLAFHSIYASFVYSDHFYTTEVGAIGHFALSSLLLLAISVGFRKYRNVLFIPLYSIAMIGYSIALFNCFTAEMMPVFKSSFYLLGIALYIVLVSISKTKQFWTLVAITTAMFFLTFIEPLKIMDTYSVLFLALFMVPVILLLVYEFIGRKIADLKPYFFWTAHSFLLVFVILALVITMETTSNPLAFLIPLLIYTYSVQRQEKEWAVKLFLYAALTMIPVNILLVSDYFNFNIDFADGLAASVLVMVILFGLTNDKWKFRIDYYVLPFGMITLFSFLTLQISLVNLSFVLLIAAFIIYLLFRRSWDLLAIIPLFFASVTFLDFFDGLEKSINISAIVIAILFLHLIGKFSYQYLFSNDQDTKKTQVDWFTIITAMFLMQLNDAIFYTDPLWMRVIPSLLLVYLLFMQINRVKEAVVKNVMVSLTAAATLLPYYLIVNSFNVPTIIAMEVKMLPFIMLTIFLSKKAWNNYDHVMKNIQTIVLVIVTVFIVGDAIQSNTIYDAIIVGGLSLISIIAGMHYRIKSYFIVGIAVLLVNVFLQTRPFWGNLPWWMYLIIGGATLIGFASFYEWQKQRPTREGKTLFQEKKEKFISSFKDWQ
jgi:hypothetical protein